MSDFDAIVVAHSEAVWRIAYRLLDDRDDAWDCHQQTFLDSLRAADRGAVRNWRALLVRIATRRAVDRLRERYRRAATGEPSAQLASLPATDETPEARAESAELRERVRRVLAELPAQQAEAFWLRHIEQLSTSDVAEQMQIEPGHLRVLVHRAAAGLRRLLGPSYGPAAISRGIAMNADDTPESDEMIAQVVDAFQRMPVPAGPVASETIASLGGAAAVQLNPVRGERRPLGHRLAALTRNQRIAMGGIGLSTAAGLLLLFMAVNSGRELSAMERMTRELQAVTSYRYKILSKNTFVKRGQHDPTEVDEEGVTYWMAPDAWHSELKILRTETDVDSGKRTQEVAEQFDEVFPSGKPGLFIDHKFKTYRQVTYEPMGSSIYPLDMLRLIRENSGEVTRELGAKEMQGKQARGYVILLKGWHDQREADQVHDPVEVWVDAATDLPLEFSYKGKHDGEYEGDYWFRATDFRWNTELDRRLFALRPPDVYADITPPSDDKDIAQIVDALALYAELAGGHYPRVAKFDAATIHDEMLKLAGFTGPPQLQWKEDKKFQRIEQAAGGLEWIARILRNRYHASYEGLEVGPQDKDKLLLGWAMFEPEKYRVIYGDRRCEILSEAEAAKLGLPEAWWKPPAADEKPDELP